MEVSRDLPTAAVLGCRNRRLRRRTATSSWERAFPHLFQRRDDRHRAGGALKNVFAIRGGRQRRLRAWAIIRRQPWSPARWRSCLRLGTAMGGNPRTFYGLSGAGDLIATCFSQLQPQPAGGRKARPRRNAGTDYWPAPTWWRKEFRQRKARTNARANLNIETPIIDQIYSVLYEGKRPDQAMQELLGRDQKAERG